MSSKSIKLHLRLDLGHFAVVYAYLRQLKGAPLNRNETVRTAISLLAKQITEADLLDHDPLEVLVEDRRSIRLDEAPNLLAGIAPGKEEPLSSNPTLEAIYKSLKPEPNR